MWDALFVTYSSYVAGTDPYAMVFEEAASSDAAASASPRADAMVGRTLNGRFRIIEAVERGVMGVVYRAIQEPLDRPVAVKILDNATGLGTDVAFRQRFLVESALTAKLSHPNTVRVFDYGCTEDGILFLAMEWLEGHTLAQVLKDGALPWRRMVSIAQQIARAFSEAHQLGVVHRDLKPANVMLIPVDQEADHVKVLDFGLVKSFVEGYELEGRVQTQQGMVMGTPEYMAPEQGDKNRADPRSDVYSLGCVMYEMLTGRPPFRGQQPLQVILKHVHEPVPVLSVPEHMEAPSSALEAVVLKCLAKSPMDRFESMEEVLAALGKAIPSVVTPQMTPAVATPMPTSMAPEVVVPRDIPLKVRWRRRALISAVVLAVAVFAFRFGRLTGNSDKPATVPLSATAPLPPSPAVERRPSQAIGQEVEREKAAAPADTATPLSDGLPPALAPKAATAGKPTGERATPVIRKPSAKRESGKAASERTGAESGRVKSATKLEESAEPTTDSELKRPHL
jgi:eukaryotic-like serine/threonine-protein kinase